MAVTRSALAAVLGSFLLAAPLAAQAGQVFGQRAVGGIGKPAHGRGVRIGLARRLVFRRHRQPTQRRALRQICIHGLNAAGSPEVHDIWMLRNTRSGCGISAVKRPSAVVTAVSPCAPPLGLKG